MECAAGAQCLHHRTLEQIRGSMSMAQSELRRLGVTDRMLAELDDNVPLYKNYGSVGCCCCCCCFCCLLVWLFVACCCYFCCGMCLQTKAMMGWVANGTCVVAFVCLRSSRLWPTQACVRARASRRHPPKGRRGTASVRSADQGAGGTRRAAARARSGCGARAAGVYCARRRHVGQGIKLLLRSSHSQRAQRATCRSNSETRSFGSVGHTSTARSQSAFVFIAWQHAQTASGCSWR